MCSQNVMPLACLEVPQKFSVVGGGGVESNFSIHLLSLNLDQAEQYFLAPTAS